jgi:hypothetical protein
MGAPIRYCPKRGGFIGPAAAFGLLGLVIACLLVIAIGLLYYSKAEAERTADAAALAGVSAYLEYGGDSAVAKGKERAWEYALKNPVFGGVLDQDHITVTATPSNNTLEVTVTVTVQTFFDRFLGKNDSVTVKGHAIAKIQGSGTVQCLKPFAIPDRWNDADSDGFYDAGETYVTATTGYGTSYKNSDGQDYNNDFGRLVTVRPSGTNNSTTAGWFFLLDLNNEGSNMNVRSVIENDCSANTQWTTGTEIFSTEPGNKVGQVNQGVTYLMNQDPALAWSGLTFTGSTYGTEWRKSRRVSTIVLYDPRYPPTHANSKLKAVGFATIVWDQLTGAGAGTTITGRLVNVIGVRDSCTTNCGSFTGTPRIIN